MNDGIVRRLAVAMGVWGAMALGAQAAASWGAAARETYLADRLEVGLRLSRFRFVNPERSTSDAEGRRGGYTPTISTYSLAERQSYRPWPYVRYGLSPHIWLQLAWERLEGRTLTRDGRTHVPYDHSNGDVVLHGPSVMLFLRPSPASWPAPWNAVTPYAGAGVVAFGARFRHDAWWHDHGRRNMAVERTAGAMVSAGASVAIARGVTADVAGGFVRARPRARYWMRGDDDPRATWTFPMDSWLMQLSLGYAF